MDASTVRPEKSTSSLRHCVACGYSLQGLPEPPRCPECGLLNIHDRFRHEVWALVDSGRWFFSSAFTPWRQRPYGWWWALDREDDVRRSFRFAAAHCMVSVILVALMVLAAGAVRIEHVTTIYRPDPDNPSSRIQVGQDNIVFGLWHQPIRWDNTPLGRMPASVRLTMTSSTTKRILLEPNLDHWQAAGVIALWVVCTWLAPAMIGLWTQIRKELPEFARAPRTIIAASNYEAHKVTYLAIVVCLALAAAAGLRCALSTPLGVWNPVDWINQVLFWSATGYALAGWVGPVRSDYTRQLVRSRFHAIRILAMYVLFFPWALVLLILGLVMWIVLVL